MVVKCIGREIFESVIMENKAAEERQMLSRFSLLFLILGYAVA